MRLYYRNTVSDPVKSHAWESIKKHYKNLDGFQPMLNLVEYILENYSYGIYGLTSMHTLCLSQTDRINLENNILKVDFIQRSFEFEYLDVRYRKGTSWKKKCDVDEAIETFEHVMKRLKWFI